MTVLDLITRSLLTLGTISEGETPSASLANQALDVLAEIIDSWSADHLFLFAQESNAYSLVASQAAYTLGTGGDFNQPRPDFVDAITIQDPSTTPVFEYPPLHEYSDQEWAALPLKALTSTFPTGFSLDKTVPLMTVTFSPVPDNSSYKAVIYTPAGILASATIALGTSLVIPRGYLRAIRNQLAADLSQISGFAPSPRGDLAKVASLAISRIKANNIQIGILGVDAALTGGAPPGYDWRSGQ